MCVAAKFLVQGHILQRLVLRECVEDAVHRAPRYTAAVHGIQYESPQHPLRSRSLSAGSMEELSYLDDAQSTHSNDSKSPSYCNNAEYSNLGTPRGFLGSYNIHGMGANSNNINSSNHPYGGGLVGAGNMMRTG